MQVIVTRPEADGPELAAKLEALGHQCIASPLLVIVPRAAARIPMGDFQAIALTSANALRNPIVSELTARFANLPVFAVGAQSAAAARKAGFSSVTAAAGDVAALTGSIVNKCIPARGPVLYLSGAETSGDLKGELESKGFHVERVVLYDAVAAESLAPRVIDAVTEGRADAVLLYSPRSARIWLSLLAKAHIGDAARRISHFCLSQNVAAALGESFTKRVSDMPEEAALLRLLDRTA